MNEARTTNPDIWRSKFFNIFTHKSWFEFNLSLFVCKQKPKTLCQFLGTSRTLIILGKFMSIYVQIYFHKIVRNSVKLCHKIRGIRTNSWHNFRTHFSMCKTVHKIAYAFNIWKLYWINYVRWKPQQQTIGCSLIEYCSRQVRVRADNFSPKNLYV